MVGEAGERLGQRVESSRLLASSIRSEKQSRLLIQFRSLREVFRFIDYWRCLSRFWTDTVDDGIDVCWGWTVHDAKIFYRSRNTLWINSSASFGSRKHYALVTNTFNRFASVSVY